MPVLNPEEEKFFQGSEKVEFGFAVASDFCDTHQKNQGPVPALRSRRSCSVRASPAVMGYGPENSTWRLPSPPVRQAKALPDFV
jgi:hypothetical protein